MNINKLAGNIDKISRSLDLSVRAMKELSEAAKIHNQLIMDIIEIRKQEAQRLQEIVDRLEKSYTGKK
jgi:hypothetical protein